MRFVLLILYKIMPVKSLRNIIKQKYKQYKNISEHKEVADFLHSKYIGKDLENFPLKPQKKELVGKKIIWQYWGQGTDKSPDIVKSCLKSVKKHSGEYEVIVLTDKNISNYIDLPDFVYDKLKNNDGFKIVFFSDLLRLSLLSVYGGIWIDATIYLTDKIPKKLLKQDFFMFQRGEIPCDYRCWQNHNIDYFGWDNEWKVNSLSSFIIAKPNNKVIESLRIILFNYWKNESKFIHYFLFQIIFNEIIKNYKNCEIICDTVPSKMSRYINEPYSVALWEKITQNNTIHKLTYYDKVIKGSVQEFILNK